VAAKAPTEVVANTIDSNFNMQISLDRNLENNKTNRRPGPALGRTGTKQTTHSSATNRLRPCEDRTWEVRTTASNWIDCASRRWALYQAHTKNCDRFSCLFAPLHWAHFYWRYPKRWTGYRRQSAAAHTKTSARHLGPAAAERA
jgi:hypothetical protein